MATDATGEKGEGGAGGAQRGTFVGERGAPPYLTAFHERGPSKRPRGPTALAREVVGLLGATLRHLRRLLGESDECCTRCTK